MLYQFAILYVPCMYSIGKGIVAKVHLKDHTLDNLGDPEAQIMNDIIVESTTFTVCSMLLEQKARNHV